MSTEGFSPYYEFYKDRREIDLSAVIPVRPHHWENLQEFIIQYQLSKIEDIETYCDIYSEEVGVAVSQERTKGFRRFHDKAADDDSVPLYYSHDVLGKTTQQRNAHFASFRNTLREFVTAPYETPAAIGPGIDGMCASCVFGGGNGGLHCKTYDFFKESGVTHKLERETENYLLSPTVEERKKQDPEKYWMQKDEVEIPKNFRVINGGKTRFARGLYMPIGLLRDVTTYRATRIEPEGDIFFTFENLLHAKETPTRSSGKNSI